jgi:molybdopterin-synthase adenylyltransferase
MDRRFLHETLYKNIDGILDKNIAILGCGAIGANLTISLARRGFKRFWLVDFDKIEEHNISTQPWSVQDLGRGKATTLATQIYMMTKVQADVYHNKLETAKLIQGDIMIDCFDNHTARKYAQGLSIAYRPVLHVGMSNQNTGEVTWDIRYVVPPDVQIEDPCNYPLSRTLIELIVIAASESIMTFFLKGKKEDYFINANNLGIKKI